jgi:glucosamine-6-phosphate isomerase
MTGHHHSEARGSQEDREPRAIPIAEARERIRTRIFDTPPALARAVAERIAAAIRRANAGGRRAVLGLATGSTPIGVYRELVRMHREEGLSFAQVETFNLDEYLPMHPESPHSYHRFMWLHLFSQVDIAPERVHILDGTLTGDAVAAHCAAFEAAIGAAGGIDFQLLGIGKTGHIGFNEPGSGSRAAPAASTSTASRVATRRRLLQREERPARGAHDGHRDDPRRAGDRDPRDR